MSKVTYHIRGFDCANCASKSERHLNKHPSIKSASIDFNNERLFITYENDELSIKEIIDIIHEVEEDEIEISLLSEKKHEKEKIIEKEQVLLLIRIALIVVLMVIAKILESTVLFDRHWAVIVLYVTALIIGIYDVVFEVIEHIVHKVNPVDEHLLMTISCLGAFSIAFFPNVETVFFDGVMVLALFQIGELIEEILSKKSKQAIKNAIDLRADKANLLMGDEIVVVNPEELEIGDAILIKVGEIIPVDGIIINGEGSLNTSSLTGESMPLEVKTGDKVLSGTILSSGSLTLKVEKEFKNSTISKIMEVVENSGEKKSKVDKFITRFARIYTPIILLIGFLYVLIYGLITKDWSTALYGGVFILIIGCPCAIVISVPLAFFAGIGLASKNGIIIKGASYIDQLCKAGTLFIDKTGTLTYGSFKVLSINPVDVSKEELINLLSVVESRSNHPIAKAVAQEGNNSSLEINKYEELPGLGIIAELDNKRIIAGNKKLLEKENIKVPEINDKGVIILAAINGKYAGYITLGDTLRDNSKELIKELNSLGVKVVLLSGDNESNVRDTADELGISEYHYGLLPQEKTKYVEEEVEKGNKQTVLFAGDGINDAPSIIRADVGIAMGDIASDVVVENADVVLVNDNPHKITQALKISRATRATAIFNITLSLTIKLAAMVLTMLSSRIAFPPHVIPLIDSLSDTGLTVLLVINSLLLIYRRIK